jgi:hypothetical protein
MPLVLLVSKSSHQACSFLPLLRLISVRENHVRMSGVQPPAHAGSSLADFSTLKMEAIRSSETSVDTRSTRRHIPEDGILHSDRRENLKFYFHFFAAPG